MRIIVNPDWLTTCGHEKWIGHEFEVTKVIDHGHRGKIYEVLKPNRQKWVVWSVRGVTEVEKDPPAEPAGDVNADMLAMLKALVSECERIPYVIGNSTLDIKVLVKEAHALISKAEGRA